MEHMTIVVREDAYDRMLTPLTFAYTQASKGVKVDMLFVLWAVRALTSDGLNALELSKEHSDQDNWLKERLRAVGGSPELKQLVTDIIKTGNAQLYACKYAAATFEVDESQLIAGVGGIVDPGWFLSEKACKADHCQYF